MKIVKKEVRTITTLYVEQQDIINARLNAKRECSRLEVETFIALYGDAFIDLLDNDKADVAEYANKVLHSHFGSPAQYDKALRYTIKQLGFDDIDNFGTYDEHHNARRVVAHIDGAEW